MLHVLSKYLLLFYLKKLVRKKKVIVSINWNLDACYMLLFFLFFFFVSLRSLFCVFSPLFLYVWLLRKHASCFLKTLIIICGGERPSGPNLCICWAKSPTRGLEVAWGQENTSIRLYVSKQRNEIQLESSRGWFEEEHILG